MVMSNSIGLQPRAIHDAHQGAWQYPDDEMYLRALAASAVAVGDSAILTASLALETEDNDPVSFDIVTFTSDAVVIASADVEEHDDVWAVVRPWRTLASLAVSAKAAKLDKSRPTGLHLTFEDGEEVQLADGDVPVGGIEVVLERATKALREGK